MIYGVWAVTRGGIVLWRNESFPVNGNPISQLVREVLLLEKGGEISYTTNDNQYSLQWIIDNKHRLFFVIITPKAHPVSYSTTLLDSTKRKFIALYAKDKTDLDPWLDYSDFDDVYKKLLQKQINKPKIPETKVPAPFVHKDEKLKQPKSGTTPNKPATPTPTQPTSTSSPTLAGKAPRGKPSGPAPGKSTKKPTKTETPTPRSKKPRNWDKQQDDDFVLEDPGSTSRSVEVESGEKTPVKLEKISFDAPTVDDSESESDDDDVEDAPQKRGFFSRYLPSLTGKTLTREDLEPLMEQYEDHLISKNVASAIAKNLCESVIKSLEGSHLSTFASAKNLVKKALTESLTRILTPKRQVDVLNDIDRQNQSGKPYSIVFVGVNGVGKSTSLSKISSWLLQNKKTLLIAACDTFRSGAVEQLKVHADRLNVPVFEQGYSSDPSHVAKFAIKKATQDRINVVLIDTAGRMQDNEPLMTALSNLVHTNNPNLVIFVGEALVGNDGVHQLVSFNESLQRLSALANSAVRNKENVIDGIFLTKFDTIDDKVGAAVSMVYSTGIPIMFVGVGQHYHDIKSLNVDTVVRSLMR